MEYCECTAFNRAVKDGFIKKPGQRLPNSHSFSKKYFITHYDRLTEMNYFMYLEFCPKCGKKVKDNDKS